MRWLAASLSAGLAILVALPFSSLASQPLLGSVGDLLHRVTQPARTVAGSLPVHAPAQGQAPPRQAAPSQSSSQPAQAGGPPEQPAMYGTNPHGQGTVVSVATSPSSSYPYTYSPGGSGGEQVVVGRGRSEQGSSGTYDAHTTILALLGVEILGVDAQQGQSHTGPLDALQTSILDAVCTGSGTFACLSVLKADTSASSSGANTDFSVAHATVGGANGVDVGVAESKSSISGSGSCQTSSGSSSAANVNVAGGPVASVAQSSETSKACQGQSPSQQASSSVIGLGGTGVPLPAPGCASGTPNTAMPIAGLLTILCNADSAAEATAPSGVREALTTIVLPTVGSALAKIVVSASESHAVAPKSSPTCSDSDHDCGHGPSLTPSCPGYPSDNVDGEGDCDHSIPAKCSDSVDHDCGHGPALTPTCPGYPKDNVNGDGDCDHHTPNRCSDAVDHDCGNGPPLTQNCPGYPQDNVNGDGDCDHIVHGPTSGPGGPSTEVSLHPVSQAGFLPFTGEDVLKVVVAGCLLAGLGLVACRYLARP